MGVGWETCPAPLGRSAPRKTRRWARHPTQLGESFHMPSYQAARSVAVAARILAQSHSTQLDCPSFVPISHPRNRLPPPTHVCEVLPVAHFLPPARPAFLVPRTFFRRFFRSLRCLRDLETGSARPLRTMR